MKFNIKSITRKRQDRYERVTQWHRWFAWTPTRISPNEVVWFTDCARVGSSITGEKYKWTYKPIEEHIIDTLAEK